MFCSHTQGCLSPVCEKGGSLTEYEVQKSVRMLFKSCVSNSHPLTSGDIDYLVAKIPAIVSSLERLGQVPQVIPVKANNNSSNS